MLQSKTKVTKFAWYVARPWSQEVKVHTSVLPLKVPPCKFLASSYTGSPCTLYSTLYPVQGHPVPVPIVDWLDRTTHPTSPCSMVAKCRYNLFYTLSKLSAEWQICTQATPIKFLFNRTSIVPFKLHHIFAFSISLDLLRDPV